MTPKEMEAKILMDGWQLVKIDGSHHHYKHPRKSGKVTMILSRMVDTFFPRNFQAA